MLLLLLFFACGVGPSLGARCENFPDVECREPNGCRKGRSDAELQALPISGYVTFRIAVPQFRRQRTKEIVIGLLGSIVPSAAYNFGQLAAGGVQLKGKRAYKYEGTPFHRIDKDHSISGGDVVFQNGSGSITANGSFAQPPDNFFVSNYGKGWVGMVENGPQYNHSIGCQFFITLTNSRKKLDLLNKQPILNLGRVIRGFELLERINDKAGRSWGSGKIRLDTSMDPILKVKRNRPRDGDISISRSRYVSLEDGAKKGWPRHAFNRPAKGCLSA